MDLDQVVDIDVRPLLSRDREDLVRLLRRLSAQEWNASSRAPGWTVKALALHLLDDDLSLLSRGRDKDYSSLLVVDDHHRGEHLVRVIDVPAGGVRRVLRRAVIHARHRIVVSGGAAGQGECSGQCECGGRRGTKLHECSPVSAVVSVARDLRGTA